MRDRTLPYARPLAKESAAHWWWSSSVAFAGLALAVIAISMQMAIRLNALRAVGEALVVPVLLATFVLPLAGAVCGLLALILSGERKLVAAAAVALNVVQIWTMGVLLRDAFRF